MNQYPTDLPLRGADVICLSSIDWDYMWQAHQEIMVRIAAAGNRVVFLENTGGVRSVRTSDASRLVTRLSRSARQAFGRERRPAANVTVVSPVLVPFPRGQLGQRLNELLVARLASKVRPLVSSDPVIYSYLPTPSAHRLTDLLAGPRSVLVYHCVADYSQLAEDPAELLQSETLFARRADLVFVQSVGLAERFARDNARVHRLPIGVDLSLFDPSLVKETDIELRDLPRPVIGYVGAVHRHVDMDLLRSLALAVPGGSIALVGPLHVDARNLRQLGNVHFLGSRSHAEIPSLIAGFDVGLIPYRRSVYTDTVNPTKLFEYLAMGCPAVSTNLPEVERLGLPEFALRIAKEHGSFVEAVQAFISPSSADDRARRRALAMQRDWAVIVGLMTELIAERRAAISLER